MKDPSPTTLSEIPDKNNKKVKGLTQGTLAHFLFSSFKVGDTCTWFGTQWEGEGKEARILPCGEPTIGAGLFCDPIHIDCSIHSVCERHKKPIQDWGKEHHE